MSNTELCTVDILSALDWQRSNAKGLVTLAKSIQQWMKDNHCKFWDDWQVDVFDLNTANDFGLSVWSRILDVPLFGEDLPSDNPIVLTTEQKRIMLKLKAFIISSNSSTYEINLKLKEILGGIKLVALDNLDMTYQYLIFDNDIIDFVQTLLKYKLLPAPNSVSVIVTITPGGLPFGFLGAPTAQGFGVGFWSSILV
jgi:hypothetical protein